MSKTRGKVSFYLKDAKAKGNTPIIATFCYNKSQLKHYEPKLSVNPKFWNPKEQKVRELKDVPYSALNATLKAIDSTILEEYYNFKVRNNNLEPTVSQLRERINIARNKLGSTIEKTKTDFFGFMHFYLNDIYKKINPSTGKQISLITVRAYKQTLRLIDEYKQHSKKQIDFEQIDIEFYNDFTYFLTHKKVFKLNTIGKHLRNIKTFMQEAFDRNLTTNISFRKKSFRVVSERTDSIYLNEIELEELERLNLSSERRLEKVRDLFLVGCWTGLRFSDFSKIKQYNIKGEFIEIEQQKTGGKVVIPIHPTVQRVVDKYRNIYPNSLPPSISNQKMNSYLKEICCKIDSLKEPVTTVNIIKGSKAYKTIAKYQLVQTHTARRSFATNQYLKRIPVHDIMSITGHKTEKAFLRYLKIENKDAAIRVSEFWKKEHNKLNAV